MARIPDQDRMAAIDAPIAHLQQAEIENVAALEIVTVCGVSQRNDFTM